MNWFLKAFKQYADFKGRARRKEYWMFHLYCIIFMMLAAIIDGILGYLLKDAGYFPVISIGYFVAILVPSFSVSVRRLHDVSKSGWMYLVNFIPFIGGIWFLVLTVTDSTPGENEYGANPKELTE